MVKLNNASQNVDNVLCEDAGLSVPDTVEKCGLTECPRWVESEWTACSTSRCVSRHTAIQKREVVCQVGNSTEADSQCDEADRPISRQECSNKRCTAVWRVEPWSEVKKKTFLYFMFFFFLKTSSQQCNAPCGGQGIKYRILKCVWYGTKRPAGNACKEQPRPAVMKVCKGESCISNCKYS